MEEGVGLGTYDDIACTGTRDGLRRKHLLGRCENVGCIEVGVDSESLEVMLWFQGNRRGRWWWHLLAIC